MRKEQDKGIAQDMMEKLSPGLDDRPHLTAGLVSGPHLPHSGQPTAS